MSKQTELEKMRNQLRNQAETIREKRNENISQNQLIKDLLEVVEFYGDAENWNGDETFAVDSDFESFRVSVEDYENLGGKKARAILESEAVKQCFYNGRCPVTGSK